MSCTNFTWPILEYLISFIHTFLMCDRRRHRSYMLSYVFFLAWDTKSEKVFTINVGCKFQLTLFSFMILLSPFGRKYRFNSFSWKFWDKMSLWSTALRSRSIAFVIALIKKIRIFFPIHWKAGGGRRPYFIPLCHFHPLTNIQSFICNFACEMTTTYF